MPANHPWEHYQGSSSRKQGPDHPSVAIGSGEDEGHMSSDDDTYQDLPEASSSSSSSKFKYSPRGRRYNFDPAAGPWWNEGIVEDAPTPSTRDNRSGRGEWETGEFPLKRPNLFIPETTGAFEVGRRKRIVQVCVAVIYCFLSAGIVFGFAAIKPVLIKEGVYRDLCTQEELDQGVSVCYGQEIRLNLMFTIAAVATNVSALPVGTILDTYGPRVCGLIGSCLLAIGALLLAFARQTSSAFDAYITSFLFLAVGGPFVYISSFHLSNAFPARSGLILSMLTGAFDASSALFLVFRMVNQKSGGAFSTQRFAVVYLITPLLVIIAQMTIMPGTSYKTVGELVQQAEASMEDESGEGNGNDYRCNDHHQDTVGKIQDFLSFDGSEQGITSSIGRNTTVLQDTNTPNPDQQRPPLNHSNSKSKEDNKDPVRGVLHGYSALNQILTPWFLLMTTFSILQMLRLNYFVASILRQYEHLLSSPALARHLNETFDLLLPLGGILSVPFIGYILDHHSTVFVLAALVLSATLIGVLGCIPHSLLAGYANVVLFVMYRPFYYTAVSDYAAKVFGFGCFGKVYGAMVCAAGLGNFAQAGLDALTFKVFGWNPVPVNMALTSVAGVAGGWLVGFVWVRARAMAAGNNESIETGDREREPLLRG